MPEGDTVFRTARSLREALEGAVLTKTDIRVPAYATVDLSGRTVDSMTSRGKHLLMRAGDDVLHTHLKMEGVWRVLRHGERWPRPAFEARVVLETAEAVAVGFSLGITEVFPAAELEQHLGYLGPDLLGDDWDAAEAVRRILDRPERAIGLALLDQSNLAGVGNVYRSELCFLRGVLPTRPAGEVDVPRIVGLAFRTLRANRDRWERTLTGDTRAGRRTWVYGRAGQPCRRCGTTIRRGELGDPVRPGMGATDRIVFWCPRCQS